MRPRGDPGGGPPSLRGTFYRVGADPAWPPFVERDFYFNADGMVAMFRFSGGYVDFRSRYVRTPRFLAEREARRSLFGAYRNPYTDDPSVAGLSRGLANTNVYWHAGRLLASKEDSPPVQIDPDTLDTVGEWTWEGVGPVRQWWEGGLYENIYARADGIWRIKRLFYRAFWHGTFEDGWAHTPPDYVPNTSVTYPEDPYGPDEILANAPRLWPDTTTFPFHYRHPVTGKEVIPDPAI